MSFLDQLGITPALLLTQIVGFLILMLLLWRFAFSRIFGVLDERRDSIQAGYDRLDAEQAQMESMRREYEKRLQGIEEEAREKIQAAVKEAQGLRDNLVSDAQAHAATIIEQGRNESERDRQKAFLEMRSQIVTLAVAAAGKVIDANLTDARQTKLVDDFIGSLGTSAISHARPGAEAYAAGSGSANGSSGAA